MEFEKDVKNPPDSAEESARGKYFFKKSETEKNVSYYAKATLNIELFISRILFVNCDNISSVINVTVIDTKLLH